MSAATPEELCRQLKACTEDRDIPGDLLKDVAFCRPLAGKVDVHAGSISSFAAMDAVVTNDYERQLDAVYLVAKYNTGFCIVDELLEPVLTPNGCTSKFELHFDSSTQLSIQIERTCLDTRDAQELAEGESNIYSIDCFDQRYAVEGDNVKRVHEAARVGPCKH